MKLAPFAALAVASLCVAKAAEAAPGLWFDLTRSNQARACPDAPQLAQTVEVLFGPEVVRIARSKKEAALHVAISVEKAGTGYVALLRVENERWSERRIVDADSECRGLAEALAVAVVLLVEPDARAQRKWVAPSAAQAPSGPAPDRRGEPIFMGAEGGGVLGTGLLGELGSPTFGAFLGLTLTRGSAKFRLTGLRLTRPQRDFGAGTLQFTAWAVSFGPCWRLGLPAGWAILPCAELGLGVQRVKARNFGGNGTDSAPWRVLGVGTTLQAPLSTWARATAALGGAFRLHRQNYFIDQQRAEVQPVFAPSFALGLQFDFEIDSGK